MKCTCVQYRKKKDGIGYDSYPCGQCMACRLNKVRDWTIRIMHEARFHKENVFLTLTYDPEHLPLNGSLQKDDAQDFMKRLRYYLGNEKVRFFLCGEYGEKYLRPHYHLVLFGVGERHPIFKGKKYDPKKKGYYLLNWKPWKFGSVFIGDVSYSSARYVASYVNKKQLGKKGKAFYEDNKLQPEFTLMSRRPGIGAEFVNFTEQCSCILKQLFIKAEELQCHVFTKTKSGIQRNYRESENLRKKLIALYWKQILRQCNELKTYPFE